MVSFLSTIWEENSVILFFRVHLLTIYLLACLLVAYWFYISHHKALTSLSPMTTFCYYLAIKGALRRFGEETN